MSLTPGDYAIYTIGVDLAGNKSAPSTVVRITVEDGGNNQPKIR